MKKVLCTIAVCLICTSAYPFKLGLEFKAQNYQTVAVNLRLAEQFELKPQLGFQLGEYPAMNLLVDGNFYLSDMSSLQHYAGFGINFAIWDDNGNSNADNSDFSLNGHYGLRYNVNDVISLFGEVGLDIMFDPFILATARPGLGCTIFLPNFN